MIAAGHTGVNASSRLKTWPWDIALALFLMGITTSIGVLIGMMVSMP